MLFKILYVSHFGNGLFSGKAGQQCIVINNFVSPYKTATKQNNIYLWKCTLDISVHHDYIALATAAVQQRVAEHALAHTQIQ